MLSRSEILITKRFLFSKKTEGYVSIFSWFSIVGISLEDFSKRIIGRGKGILREENTMGAIQANVFTDGGVGGRHGMRI